MKDELLSVVASDLKFLADEWNQEIDDHSLRRSSNVLRIQLVDENLLNAWRQAGFTAQPQILAPSLQNRLQLYPLDKIQFAQTGGATYKGITVQALFELKIALGPDDMKKLFQLGPTSPVTQQDLTGFVDSTCIVFEGTEITRKELVKYVANKLGGTHIDFARNPNKPLEAKFAKLDKIRESMSTAGKNSIC